VTERPILFSGAMVRAILDGRKTQTRRVVKLVGSDVIEERVVGSGEATSEVSWPFDTTWADGDDGSPWYACPYGEPGDRLWVRETWAHDGSKAPPLYRASWQCKRDYPGVPCEHGPDRWRPSIHMPRWASRITLEVTGVRVERLQAISEADAIAEGVERADVVINGHNEGTRYRDYTGPNDPSEWFNSARASFRSLWECINGPDSWEVNPWVWCVEFPQSKEKTQ
jgi:hypothetical protein